MEYSVLREQNETPEFLIGGGEMGQRIREFDWSNTSLGPVESWPRSLRTCVQIMLTSRQPIWIGWGEELIKLYNDPYRAIVGGKHPWALGKPASIVWRDIWRDIEPMLKKVMYENEGTYVEKQLLIMERNGYAEETYYTFSYTPIAGDSGITEGMICFNTDDTERVVSERQLRTLTQLGNYLTDAKTDDDVFKRTINALEENSYDFPFALLYQMEDDKGVLVNATALGENADKVPKLIDINSDNEVALLFSKACKEKKASVFEDLQTKIGMMPLGAWNVPPDKAIILPIAQRGQKESYGVLVVGANPFHLIDESYLSFFGLVADQIATILTTVHVLEEERKRLDALAEIDRAKTTFFSNISHEFRTPLTLLLSPLEDLLNDSSIRDDNREKAGVAFRNAHRMQKLVNLLLEFSRIEAGRMEANFTAVDIVSLTEDLVSNFRSAIEKAGMELLFKSETIDEAVYVDVDMWEKIILNLLSNAFKYSEEGSIEVSVKRLDSNVEVSVKDTGVGIPEHELEKVFERFHRVQNVMGRSQEGTGIGLAMVKELVKLHNGKISVESKVGEGSVFRVLIPFGEGRSRSEVKITPESTRPFFSKQSVYVDEALQWLPEHDKNLDGHSKFESVVDRGVEKKYKVLLADDNADMRRYVHRLLDTAYHVVVVSDGEEAYVKALQHKPDLIISDIMMPKLDGFGLLQKLKNNLTTRNIPLIFLSARAGEEAKVEGITAGADDYLVKPFSSKELLARVSNHIAIAAVRRQTEKEFYNLFLQSPAHIHVFKGPEHVLEFFHPLGIPFAGRDITGMKVREALPDLEGQGFFEMLDSVYHEGKTIRAENSKATFTNEKEESHDHYFDITYLPWKDVDGKIQGILQFTIEVTETVTQRLRAEASERKFRSIAQQAPVAMSVMKGPTHIVEVANSRLLEMWGRSHEDVIDKSVLSVFPELVKQGFNDLLDNVFKTGQPFVVNEMPVTFNRHGKYEEILVNLVYEPFRNENNEIEGVLAVGTDVTEQVIARRKIAEAEERLRIATEISGLGTWEFDPATNIIFCSQMAIELFGFEQQSRIGIEDAIRIVVPEDKHRVESALRWALNPESKGKYDIEYTLVNKVDKKQRIVRTNGQVFFDAHDKPIRFIGTVLDITERRKAEQEIKASEARFRILSTSIPQIVWTTDNKGNTTYISEQFEKFTGQKAEESYATWQNLIQPEDKERLLRKTSLAIRNKNGFQEEVRIKNINTGDYRWFLANSQPLKDNLGNIVMWIGSASDIQDLKEQSNWLEFQIAERTKSLKELNQSLKLSNEDLQQFAHVASHDLKEPIRKIKTYSHRIQDDFKDFLPEQGNIFLKKILSATDRMYSMIDGVLSYSTITAIDQPNSTVNLNDVIKNIMTDLELLIQEKKAAIIYDNLPYLEGAPVLIYQLFYNLINNSIKFSKANEPPVINIESHKEQRDGKPFDKIILHDNGIGFKQEQAERIFTTFTRLNSKDKYEGTGLGLALCKKIVHRHGGYIYANGEENKGATFIIFLPTKQYDRV